MYNLQTMQDERGKKDLEGDGGLADRAQLLERRPGLVDGGLFVLVPEASEDRGKEQELGMAHGASNTAQVLKILF